jgi:tetratricopeptide (TPR) repeat protein
MVPGLPFFMPPVRDDEKNPPWLGAPTETVSDSKVELPKGYSPQVPPNIDLKYDFAEYHASYSQKEGALIAKRRMVIKLHEVPVAELDDYRSFIKNLQNDVAQYVKTSSLSSGDDLDKRGYEAVKNGEFSSAITLLKSAIEADPKSKSAWNDLGLAYLGLNEYDLAISSFQKQIEISPSHQYAYNNLGRVYLRQRKYEEAVKWFSKQAAINPKDKYAHSNLGTAFLEEHRYQEAIPELEQAESLTPDDAEAEVRLGEAYLGFGEDQKAMDSFSKAVKISDRPLIWNNIAYRLSLKNAHLDVARRYAESAVTATEATLRTHSLDQLDSKNIGLTPSLASYWDTLGWVEFAEGNLEKAEKYILAAWQLDPHSEVGDHLGQIYEKRGEKERAVHFYALAMDATRPDPETRTRLSAVVGGNDKVDPIVEKSRDELIAQRTIKLDNSSKREGTADFIMLFTSGHGAEMSVEDVRFVSGDEKLKSFVDALRTAHYGQSVPDEASFKIFRRGTLSCAATATSCSLLLALPDEVKSAD